MKARHKDTGEIIELAEEGIISCDGRRFCWYQVELIPEPIDDFKPSLPYNIDEAAEEYGRKEYSHAIHFWDEGLSKNKPEVMKEDFVDAFKAGAEWMAGPGITFEGKASRRYENGLAGFVSWILFDQQKEAHLLVNQGEEADVIINIRKK